MYSVYCRYATPSYSEYWDIQYVYLLPHVLGTVDTMLFHNWNTGIYNIQYISSATCTRYSTVDTLLIHIRIDLPTHAQGTVLVQQILYS